MTLTLPVASPNGRPTTERQPKPLIEPAKLERLTHGMPALAAILQDGRRLDEALLADVIDLHSFVGGDPRRPTAYLFGTGPTAAYLFSKRWNEPICACDANLLDAMFAELGRIAGLNIDLLAPMAGHEISGADFARTLIRLQAERLIRCLRIYLPTVQPAPVVA